MADIARRADVGIATLYRRFPSKPSLLSAVFGDQIRSCAAEFESSADVADPWSTLQGLLVRLCALQAENKGLAGLLVDAFVTGHEFEEERLLLRRSLIRLVERAREAGRAHPDIDIASIELLLKANAGVIAASTGDPGADSAHFVGLMLRSFEPAPPPSAAEPGGGR